MIAAGETWALASEAIAAPYRTSSPAIVYRPFVEPPIPCWLALVWLPEASAAVQQLIDVARRDGAGGDGEAPARPARDGGGPRRPPSPPPPPPAIAARPPRAPPRTPLRAGRAHP